MLFIRRRFSRRNPPPGYYHYLYLREDGTPYYSGKGKGVRAWDKGHTVKPPTDLSLIVITHWGLTELWALALERRHIRWYGRKDNGTGILRNGTDGGEGGNGSIKTETQRKQQGERMRRIVDAGLFNYPAKSLKGKKHSKERIQARVKHHLGAKRSPETCRNIAMSLTGKTQSPETIAKRILYVTCEHCGLEVDKGNYSKWHGSKCSVFTGIKREPVSPRDSKNYTLVHESGEVFVGTRQQFMELKEFRRTSLSGIINGARTIRGWKLLSDDKSAGDK